jgi:hypothetical protein
MLTGCASVFISVAHSGYELQLRTVRRDEKKINNISHFSRSSQRLIPTPDGHAQILLLLVMVNIVLL